MIYGDGRLVKEVDVGGLDYGYGRVISLNNLWTFRKFNSVHYEINYSSSEISKDNNEVVLTVSS